jgi:hypothetical protein
MLDENLAVKGILVGYIAEQKLITQLKTMPEFKFVSKIPDRDEIKGDILIETVEGKLFTIEVKCLGSTYARENLVNGGIDSSISLKMSDRAILDSGQTTSCPDRNSYDILAVCLAAATGEWNFKFIHSKYLPTSQKFPGRIQSSMSINTDNTPCLHSDLIRVLADLD